MNGLSRKIKPLKDDGSCALEIKFSNNNFKFMLKT